MANITLSGTLLDPNSGFAARDKIRFTHKTTTGSTLKGSVSTLVIGADGVYSIDLQYGLVLVERRDSTKSQYINLGVVTVNADNPATTLPELLSATVPVSSEELIEFQSILADCVAAQLAAEAAAAEAAAEAAELGTNAGASLVGTSSGITVQESLDALTDGQTGGLIVFATYALLDAYTPQNATEEKSSFKVTNDSNTALNGYYSWVSGTAYTKDADLVVNVIEEGNTSDAVSGKAVVDYVKNIDYVTEFKEVEQKALARSMSRNRAPIAPVVILLGQSLNAPRGNVVQAKVAQGIKMLVGGCAVNTFEFFTYNVENTSNFSDVSSTLDLFEEAGQSPCAGIANKILGGNIDRAYIGSIAVGSRGIDTINTGGIKNNLYAFVHRLCEEAIVDGYTPKVVFYSAHGERDAYDGMSEQDYFEKALTYYKLCQLIAAQAMQDISYRAPILLSYPMQNSRGVNGSNDVNIASAIRSLTKNIVNGVDVGSIYQWPVETDRVHPTPDGYVMRGEYVGSIIRQIISNSFTPRQLEITDATLSGTTVRITFSEDVIQDLSMDAGTNLNTGVALDGFEYLDNGSFIAINNLSYEGSVVVATLNSAPIGTIEQQQLRIASQTTSSTLAAGSSNHPGSQVRKATAVFKSVFDTNHVNYEWAIKQIINVRSA